MLCNTLLFQTGGVGILHGMQNFGVDKVKSTLCDVRFILKFMFSQQSQLAIICFVPSARFTTNLNEFVTLIPFARFCHFH